MKNQEDQILRDKFLKKKISVQEYYNQLSFYTEDKIEYKNLLIETIKSKNNDILNDLWYIGIENQLFNNFLIDELNELIIAEWHCRHEAFAEILCDLPNEKSIEYIKKCAEMNWKHEEYNDCSALRGKLLFILRKIDTPKAKKVLIKFANGNNKILKDWAEFQLSKMN